jgi:ubiquinol-cytochrome c reductase cytochrome b subunit
LHSKGSSNKLSAAFKLDKLMFHPYFTIKDVNFILIILFIFLSFVGFFPNYLGHPDNYIPADPLVTPAHIVPE